MVTLLQILFTIGTWAKTHSALILGLMTGCSVVLATVWVWQRWHSRTSSRAARWWRRHLQNHDRAAWWRAHQRRQGR